MGPKSKLAFDHIPRTPRGHFVLYLYAAIFRLINHIRELSAGEQSDLEAVFTCYPFLGEYFLEMRKYMPEGVTWEDAPLWWQEEIAAWEETCSGHLPLRALAAEASLSFTHLLAFFAAGLIEEDSRFGTVFEKLQQPLGHRRPAMELAGRLLLNEPDENAGDPWKIYSPLFAAGLVNATNREAPRSEWIPRVPSLLWDAARGQTDGSPGSLGHHREPGSLPRMDDLILPAEFLQQIRMIPTLVKTGRVGTIIIRSAQGSLAMEALAAVARQLSRGLIEADGPALSEGEAGHLLGPLCSLTGTMPVLEYDLGPGETIVLPRLPGYSGPVGLILGSEGGLALRADAKALTLTLPVLGVSLREKLWRRALNGRGGDTARTLSESFCFSGGHIHHIAQMAAAQAGLDDREGVRVTDVRKACRQLNRQVLDSLASRLEFSGSWNDLIAGETTTSKLQELERRCRYREKILHRLGPAFGNGLNRGVRALFTGASGTGKTLAAKILSAELGEMDVYRVDLAAVINKYIGETEKNLHRVLSRAEDLDVILLLDEGDTLLGRRTEIRSANDRYANLETNYLLQRLETYQGIVIITTNLGDNIDPAFQRRMDVVVPFFPPQAEERLQILSIHLPSKHVIEPAFLEFAAQRCALNGAQLRQAALHSILLALDDGDSPVGQQHLEEALRSEFRKAGGTFPLEETSPWGQPDAGMKSFLDALTES